MKKALLFIFILVALTGCYNPGYVRVVDDLYYSYPLQRYYNYPPYAYPYTVPVPWQNPWTPVRPYYYTTPRKVSPVQPSAPRRFNLENNKQPSTPPEKKDGAPIRRFKD